ncbi:aldehyde dehydrogenase family protein [Streptomyces afghaniensis]|uniref:aldehyde dehydrogenase family protein n=1 Tax=Streptomyces afghaniensis TaxID=66865 RepID=UPI0027D89D3A|nr:aldehyde dehydrogenase family protein [Streptomyces afghaniensis]
MTAASWPLSVNGPCCTLVAGRTAFRACAPRRSGEHCEAGRLNVRASAQPRQPRGQRAGGSCTRFRGYSQVAAGSGLGSSTVRLLRQDRRAGTGCRASARGGVDEGQVDASAERAGLEGALRAVGFCRAHHAAVAVGVGALLGHEHVVRAGADAVDPGVLVDLLGEEVLGGVLEGLGHGRAVPVASTSSALAKPVWTVTVVNGDAGIGAAIVAAPDVRMVSFTGGFATGEAISRTAGVKKLAMDLGGNAPVIVMDDADLDEAVASYDLAGVGVVHGRGVGAECDAGGHGGVRHGASPGGRGAWGRRRRPRGAGGWR